MGKRERRGGRSAGSGRRSISPNAGGAAGRLVSEQVGREEAGPGVAV